MTKPEGEVHNVSGKDLFVMPAAGEGDIAGIHQKSIITVHTEKPDIVSVDIVVKAVVLPRVYRIELIDLDKRQPA